MTIVSELYDDYILVYDYDEKPIRPFKLSPDAASEDIRLCKREMKAIRGLELRGMSYENE